MGATFSRIKNWTVETLFSADLNTEFDNFLTNLTPAGIDDYSANVAEMQTQTDPGEVGTESLATSTAAELARIRFQLKTITGKTYWYSAPGESLESISAAVGGGLPANRIISGRARTGSSQLIALTPAGSGNGRTVTIKGASTSFIYNIAGTQYTISTDVASATLLAAPSTNNTALVNDAGILDGEETKYIGEFGSSLAVDAMGTEITSLVGKLAGFKITAASDEYFIARVKSTTELDEIRRGHYFDSADAVLPRIVVANNDTITLMKLAWVFATTTGTVAVTYVEPTYSADEPGTPANGDYWFDLANDTWKTFDGAAFVAANATFIGTAVSDATDTLAARTDYKFIAVDDINTLDLSVFDATQIRANNEQSEISVFGSLSRYKDYLPRWDMDSDTDTGVSETASTSYYLYVDEDGDTIISDVAPIDMEASLKGLYHPFHTWRCVGQAHNDASSNLEAPISYSNTNDDNYAVTTAVAASALTVKVHRNPTQKFSFAGGVSTVLASLLPGTSIVVSSGSTLGTASTENADLMLHIIKHDNRAELAISFNKHFGSVTTIAEGGAGAADTSEILYSTTARATVLTQAIAKMESSQTTAGTWATAITVIYTGKSNLITFNRQTFVASGTLNVAGHVNNLDVLIAGAGGGGGSGNSVTSSSNTAGGGGGAGSMPYRTILNVLPGEAITVTIGAGGVAGTSVTSSVTGNTGSIGGTTTFGSYLTVIGGQGGNGADGNADAGDAIGNTWAGSRMLIGAGAGSVDAATSGVGLDTLFASGGASASGTDGSGGGGGAGFAAGGAGASGDAGVAGSAGSQGSGGGGGGGRDANAASGAGGVGGTGIIIVRWVI